MWWLADEINRTTPRTQSALLEAMNDGQVSLDGHTHRLEPPFMVVATQNSEEHYGTYSLGPNRRWTDSPCAIRIDYPSAEDEKGLVLEAPAVTDDALGQVAAGPCLLSEIISLQEAAARVRISPELAGYIVDVARETTPLVVSGPGPVPAGCAGLAERGAAASALVFRPRTTCCLTTSSRWLCPPWRTDWSWPINSTPPVACARRLNAS